jgi:hypothetical protein
MIYPGLSQELFEDRFRRDFRYRQMRKQIVSPGIKRRSTMKALRPIIVLLMILGTAGWAVSGVIPAMEEFLNLRIS